MPVEIEFDVNVLDKIFRVKAETYSRARTIAAHRYKDKYEDPDRVMPVTFYTMYSECEKVERSRMGRRRIYVAEGANSVEKVPDPKTVKKGKRVRKAK